ncbi:hypothetical protein [Endozoicomonas sp. SESOKO4]|uniref:hypothetical protein n=1 Tax=Endozoicomonas sp. SESOKO4 TaxID=2828745 RepID=UPI002148ED47|nr:hypothetical protein [Endozoicomonas sp. SESOKO4]
MCVLLSVLLVSVLLADEVVHDLDQKLFAFAKTPVNRFVEYFLFCNKRINLFELLTLFIEDQRDSSVSSFKNFVVFLESIVKSVYFGSW